METIYIVYMLALTFFIEFITMMLRMMFHLQSAPIQKQLHFPRIHHSYPGSALVIAFFMYHNIWFFVIGASLVLSDLLHHTVVVPLIRIFGFDITMAHHKQAHIFLERLSGISLIVLGLFALVTPFTPGSWLAVIGLIFLIGKERTRRLFQLILGKKLFTKMHLDKYLDKIHLE